MKNTVFVVILLLVSALAFSQQDRFNGLKTKIDDTSAKYHQILDTASVDFRSAENRVKYEAFNKRYQSLAGKLHMENVALERRSKAATITPGEIQERRSKVEALVGELDALKSEYDAWIRTLG
jgi:myosin heavy subunit